eukprot:gene734-852_t
MADVAVDPVGSDEEEEIDEEKIEQMRLAKIEAYAAQLLPACRSNDSEQVQFFINEGVDPALEDANQWSAMIWAACHGNLELTKFLIDVGAVNVYTNKPQLATAAEGAQEEGVAEVSAAVTKQKRRKHSPLHWAAFKGHMKTVWLLLGAGLDPNDRDAIGNTVLHQAAAGGHLEVLLCLLAQGSDVYGKNHRGSVNDVKDVLKKAMNATQCEATKKQFSSTVMRYMCMHNHKFYCESAVDRSFAYEHYDSTVKQMPVTYCAEVKTIISQREKQCEDACALNDEPQKKVDAIESATNASANIPVDAKIRQTAVVKLRKLKSEINLQNLMDAVQTSMKSGEVQAVGVDTSLTDMENFVAAIETAKKEDAELSLISKALDVRCTLDAEITLHLLFRLRAKRTNNFISHLEGKVSAATDVDVAPDMLDAGHVKIRTLTSERDLTECIKKAKPLEGVISMREYMGDDAAENSLPEWVFNTEQFLEFQYHYKTVVELAEKNEIDAELLERGQTKLRHLENCLAQKVLIDEELALRAKKKKK